MRGLDLVTRPTGASTVLAMASFLLAAQTWVGAPLTAQRWMRGVHLEPNAAYDGRFTFARIRYTVYGRSGWEYDYPTMERNLMTMMQEITALRPHVSSSNIHSFDDPQLLRYPVAYLSEPGYWIPSDAEVQGLRTYLAKGGFLIVDDFMLGEWRNFEAQIRRALPEGRIHRLELTEPIFNSFFRIKTLDMTYPHNASLKAEFFGIYEDNDPSRRLLVIINYNNDLGDYMEWSAAGWWPVNITNEAYKFAINYIVYGLTH
jgi:hypothetical protein